MDSFLNISDASKELGVSKKVLRQWKYKKQIDYKKRNGIILYNVGYTHSGEIVLPHEYDDTEDAKYAHFCISFKI